MVVIYVNTAQFLFEIQFYIFTVDIKNKLEYWLLIIGIAF